MNMSSKKIEESDASKIHPNGGEESVAVNAQEAAEEEEKVQEAVEEEEKGGYKEEEKELRVRVSKLSIDEVTSISIGKKRSSSFEGEKERMMKLVKFSLGGWDKFDPEKYKTPNPERFTRRYYSKDSNKKIRL